MPKYINAREVEKLVENEAENLYGEGLDFSAEQVWKLQEKIRNMPSADVEEVVRCKDCKYALPEGRENVYICTAKKNPNYCWFDEYCSCGDKGETE